MAVVFPMQVHQYLIITNHQVLFSLETKNAVYQAPGIKNFFDTINKERFKDNLELARTYEDREKNFKRKTLQEFDLYSTPVMKLCFISPVKENFCQCVDFLKEFFNIVIFSKPDEKYVNGEIIVKHCTKGDAVKFVTKYFKADIKDTIAYGDSMNDYEMLQVAHLSVVSQKSSDELKEMADDQFEDPDNDGIYKHLKKIGLI